MSRRRYEILLPIRYNDGTPVEPEKFFQTQEEIVARFGALTTSPELLRGVWVHEGHRFEDQHWRLVIDAEPGAETVAFFREFKERLKARFQQIDLWIISFEIEIL
jgi:hypothetical protein